VGGPDVAKQVAEIMGVEYEHSTAAKQVPQVHCRGGGETAEYAFEYNGVQDCVALYALFGGNKVCKYGCLGLGSCIAVCPADAIAYDNNGLVWVNKDLCIGCGQCVKVCPTGVMQWLPYEADFLVACSSKDKGGKVRKYCKVGCIACKICEKKSPEGGYKIEDNLCRIDFAIAGDRREGAEACPPKCIVENKAQLKT
jgi:Na+-translocating ferredoxin:NAD+ oxidoreductase RNF subunit RnfB